MCIRDRGRGGITLTGQLGDVMKESAHAAFGYIRSRAADFGINEEIFQTHELHIHVPAGATPKDGPSAGITLATAILSRLTGVAIRHDVAMTGEITLTGKVLPIGGLKEKSLAAMRAGIKTIIMPDWNAKDLVDIPDEYREKLNFVPVKTYEDVAKIAFVGDVFAKKNTNVDSIDKKVKKSSKRLINNDVAIKHAA